MPGCSASLVGTFETTASDVPGTRTRMFSGETPTARRLPTARSAAVRSTKMPTVGVIVPSPLSRAAADGGDGSSALGPPRPSPPVRRRPSQGPATPCRSSPTAPRQADRRPRGEGRRLAARAAPRRSTLRLRSAIRPMTSPVDESEADVALPDHRGRPPLMTGGQEMCHPDARELPPVERRQLSAIDGRSGVVGRLDGSARGSSIS